MRGAVRGKSRRGTVALSLGLPSPTLSLAHGARQGPAGLCSAAAPLGMDGLAAAEEAVAAESIVVMRAARSIAFAAVDANMLWFSRAPRELLPLARTTAEAAPWPPGSEMLKARRPWHRRVAL